jgi:hypothetical protein
LLLLLLRLLELRWDRGHRWDSTSLERLLLLRRLHAVELRWLLLTRKARGLRLHLLLRLIARLLGLHRIARIILLQRSWSSIAGRVRIEEGILLLLLLLGLLALLK